MDSVISWLVLTVSALALGVGALVIYANAHAPKGNEYYIKTSYKY